MAKCCYRLCELSYALLIQSQLMNIEQQSFLQEQEHSTITGRSRELAYLALESVNTLRETAQLYGCKAAVVVMGATALGGIASTEAVATDNSANKQVVEQSYNDYLNQFPDAVYKKSFSEFYTSSNAHSVCASAHAIYNNATYKPVPGKRGKVSVTLERKSAVFADEVVMTSDPTPGPSTREDQVWADLAVPCSRLVDVTSTLQIYHVGKRTNKGKKINDWMRLPGSTSVDFPTWNPDAVVDPRSDDPAANPILTRTDTVEVKLPKGITAKDIASKKYYPTIILDSKSKLDQYRFQTATLLGPLHKKQRTVYAGSNYMGKGGAMTQLNLIIGKK